MPKFAELLICEVQKYPCLYSVADKNYKSKQLKKHIWNVIALRLGLERSVIQTKWASIRDRYQREKRTNGKLNSGVGSVPKKRKPWNLFPLLWFLERSKFSTSSSINNVELSTNIEIKEEEPTNIEIKQEEPTEYFVNDLIEMTIETDVGQDEFSEEMVSANSSLAPSPSLINVSNQRLLSTTQNEVLLIPSTSKGKTQKTSTCNDFDERSLDAVEKSDKPLVAAEEDDEYKNFCLSLVPVFRRLSPRKAALLKLKVIQDCLDIEFHN